MANFISDIISYGCKFGTFSEIANQFANIRFGDIVKVPVTSTVLSQNVMICIVLQICVGWKESTQKYAYSVFSCGFLL